MLFDYRGRQRNCARIVQLCLDVTVMVSPASFCILRNRLVADHRTKASGEASHGDCANAAVTAIALAEA